MSLMHSLFGEVNHLQKCYKKMIDPETGDEVEIAYIIKNGPTG